MTRRKPPKIEPDAKVSDIDLDKEEFLYKGERLTEEKAEQLAEDILRKARRGRPSLSGGRTHSPEVKARVPVELRDRLRARAEREHKGASQVIREALEAYLEPR